MIQVKIKNPYSECYRGLDERKIFLLEIIDWKGLPRASMGFEFRGFRRQGTRGGDFLRGKVLLDLEILAGIDQIRVLDLITVGFEDLRPLEIVTIDVRFPRDAPQGIGLNHRIVAHGRGR